MDISTQTSSARPQTIDRTVVVSSSSDESSRSWTVYKATSPSGRIYVGVTSRELGARRIEHRYLARSGSSRHFSNALRKYGGAMRCSDGVVFDSMAAAARGTYLAVAQVRHSLKTGRSTQRGLTFTKVENGV